MKLIEIIINKYLIKLIILMLIISMGRNIYSNLSSNRELVEARRELEEITQTNIKLASEIEILDTNEFIELTARNELGLVKKHEIILVLPDDNVLESLIIIDDEKEEKTIPNWQKWKRLLL